MLFSTIDFVVSLTCISASLVLSYRTRRSPGLKVQALFIYPIKSLLPISVPFVTVEPNGLKYDRRFILVTPLPDGTFQNHLISSHPKNVLIKISLEDDVFIFTATDGSTYSLPVSPSRRGLPSVEINLHASKTADAVDMGEEAADFFSRACEVPTRLVYLGSQSVRPVLGNLSQGKDNGIAFQDHGAMMVANSKSLDALGKQWGQPMSIVPLRPNVLVGPSGTGSTLNPWVEDFWAELKFASGVTMRLTANCVRCVSLNIDYTKGTFLEGNDLPLRALAKNRRVDSGSHSPVFGRYGFVDRQYSGDIIRVGDSVAVSMINTRRTVFDWPF